jgi:hypothetical protein
MYVWSDFGDPLRAYHFDGAKFGATPISQTTLFSANAGYSAGTLTLSANNSTPGSGIVWASVPDASGIHGIVHGVLHAYNADDLTDELWSSVAAGNDMGNWPKNSPPTVANGRVYMSSFQTDADRTTSVNVYGLLNHVYPAPSAAAVSAIISTLLLSGN